MHSHNGNADNKTYNNKKKKNPLQSTVHHVAGRCTQIFLCLYIFMCLLESIMEHYHMLMKK